MASPRTKEGPSVGFNDAVIYYAIDQDPVTGEYYPVPVLRDPIRGHVEKPWGKALPLDNLYDDPELNRARRARIGGGQQ